MAESLGLPPSPRLKCEYPKEPRPRAGWSTVWLLELQVQPCRERLIEGETAHLYSRVQSADRYRGLSANEIDLDFCLLESLSEEGLKVVPVIHLWKLRHRGCQ